MNIEQMTEEQIDKLELEYFRVREELQMQLQQVTNVLAMSRSERIKRAQKAQAEKAEAEAEAKGLADKGKENDVSDQPIP